MTFREICGFLDNLTNRHCVCVCVRVCVFVYISEILYFKPSDDIQTSVNITCRSDIFYKTSHTKPLALLLYGSTL